jgi:ribosome-associated protein
MNFDTIKKEITYKAVRSSGAGGQNVNKVSTKIIISFSPINSLGLNDFEKELIQQKLNTKISVEGTILIASSQTRSQLKNKEIALNKLFELLQAALKVQEKRIATKIPKRVIKKRLEDKKNQSFKKIMRKNINL